MAKPLIVSLNGVEIPCLLEKVDRSDLYGYTELETLDEQGRKCVLATLADDGKSVISSGGSALATVTPEGNWIEKKACKPTDNQGKEIVPYPSSFSAPVPLEMKVGIDEYLSHNIRSVYQISDDAELAPLMEELKKGTIFQFPYSFRGGCEPDAGFLLLAADGTPFFALGSPTKLEFVGFEQPAPVTEDDPFADDEEEALDFSMM